MAALEPQYMAILKKVLADQACEGAVPDLLQARHRAAGVHPRLRSRDGRDHLHGGDQGARRHQHAGGAGQGRSRHAVVQARFRPRGERRHQALKIPAGAP